MGGTQMNTDHKPADAIPVSAASATLKVAERWNGFNLKMACNEFLFKWVQPDMTIAEFDRISCELLVKIQEEWDRRAKA